MTNPVPYEALTPHLILDAIDSLNFSCDGSLSALNSYENRVYQVGFVDAPPMIVKFYRPLRWSRETILEEHQFALELLDHEIPVVAPWVDKKGQSLHEFQGFQFALFPRWGGRALELDNLDQLEWMGRFVGRLHAIGASRSFLYRPSLTVQHYGFSSYDYLLKSKCIPDYLIEGYTRIVGELLKEIHDFVKSLGEIRFIRLHGDLHLGNVLWDDSGPHIVDLDDCVNGPAIQDIWMLLSNDEEQCALELDVILEAYQMFQDFNYRELQWIKPLRILRQLYYSAWLARRWQDPAFPRYFPWFNTQAYWEEELRRLTDYRFMSLSCKFTGLT